MHKQTYAQRGVRRGGEEARRRYAHSSLLRRVQNLRALNLHFTDGGDFGLDLKPLSHPRDALIPLGELGGSHLSGNEVRLLGSRKALEHPTWIERLARAAKGGLWGAAAKVGLADDEDDDDDEEEDEDQHEHGRTVRGGLGSMPERPLPFKLTVLLPPEKRSPYLRLGVQTAASANLRGERQLDVGFPNLLGFGDRWSLKVQQGLDASLFDLKDTSLHGSVTVPDMLTVGSSNELSVHVEKHPLPDSSMQQEVRSAQFRWAPRGAKHSLVYTIAQRDLQAVSTRLPDEQIIVPATHAPVANAAAAPAAAAPAAPASGFLHAARSRLPSWLVAPAGAFGGGGAVPGAAHVVSQARWREPSPSVCAMVSGGAGCSRSLKSSLKYSFEHLSASMDSAATPTQGWSAAASAELAGIAGIGDAKFLRIETEAKRFFPLLRGGTGKTAFANEWDLSFGVGGLAQYVHSLSSPSAAGGGASPSGDGRVFFSDRVFLGHSLSLRGFPPNACGPHDGRDALGGELALATAAHLDFNIPGFKAQGLRANLFWNAGNLIGLHHRPEPAAAPAAQGPAVPPLAATLPRSSSLSTLATHFLASTRQSVGFGISAPLSMGGPNARFEFNFVRPIASQPHDQVKGQWPVQFGIGVQWI